MTRRIAKKRAALAFAVAVSVPLALDHGRVSFWGLDRKAQRNALAGVLRSRLGISRDIARRAALLACQEERTHVA